MEEDSLHSEQEQTNHAPSRPEFCGARSTRLRTVQAPARGAFQALCVGGYAQSKTRKGIAMTAGMILLIIALVCWFLAAVPLPFASPVQLGWLGMFFWGLTLLVGR